MEEFAKIFFTSLFGGLVAVFLLRVWLVARITNSIKSEYDRQLEVYKRTLDRKQKIELVSELLAEWIKHPKGEVIPKEQRTKLNKLSFQATLWLPTELAVELSKALQNQLGAKSIFEILLLARKLLLEDNSLSVDSVTFWKPELEQQGDPVLATSNRTN